MSRKKRRRKYTSVKPSHVRAALQAGVKFVAIRTAIVSRDATGKEHLLKPNVSVREVVKQNSQEMRCKVLSGALAGSLLTFSWYGVTIIKKQRSLWLYAKQECGSKELVLIIQPVKEKRNGRKKGKEIESYSGT